MDAALAASVKEVLLVMDKTVPMTTLPVVLIIFPTLISVRKAVPVPVIVVEALEVVIVPVLAVLGQAVALQLPEVMEITVAPITLVTEIKEIRMATIRHLRDCKRSFIRFCLAIKTRRRESKKTACRDL